MSQDTPRYETGTGRAITPACLERYGAPNYQPPTYSDVAALKAISGRTGGELAKLAGVEARTFRKWIAPPEADNRQIPYSAWRLLLIELGMI